MHVEIEPVPIFVRKSWCKVWYFLFLIVDGAGFPHLIVGLTMNQWLPTGESAFPLNLSENHVIWAETNNVYLSINKTVIHQFMYFVQQGWEPIA